VLLAIDVNEVWYDILLNMEKIYNKLVRDKVPDIINTNENGIATSRTLNDIEYAKELNLKLQEEVNEYLASENLEELADILEVIHSMLSVKGKSFGELDTMRIEKANSRGGFGGRIFLEKVKAVK